jgi:hypothetical protein
MRAPLNFQKTAQNKQQSPIGRFGRMTASFAFFTAAERDRPSHRSSLFGQVPFLHRQDRLVEPEPPFQPQMGRAVSPGRDHGMQTPPGIVYLYVAMYNLRQGCQIFLCTTHQNWRK